MSSSKRIAKNTFFLYIRMFLMMGITLYTSRVVLQELGVSDYGIYSLVGGVVAMLGVLNAAMATATQRYLSFDLGKADQNQLKKTFSATLSIHVAITFLVLILTETLGLWYVNNKMNFPVDKYYAVNVLYQFSILTLIISIIQVPYNALILARERMKVFAYVSIIEAFLKLIIVYMLGYFGGDKLIIYGFLTFIVAFIIRIVYQIYCRRQFEESKYHFQWDKKYFVEIISYSGWNLFGNIAVICRNQGNNVVLNLFFGTLINASYGVTNQVQAAVSLFVTNFQAALNPQIIKSYAVGDFEKMYKLICKGSKLSFFLVLFLFFPIYNNIDFILKLWLVNPPQYTNTFIKLALVVVLIDCLSGPLMVSAQATGKVKYYQIFVGTLLFINLPLSYLLLKFGHTKPEIVFYVSIVISIIAFLFRLFFLKRMISFPVMFYLKNVIIVVGVIIISCIAFNNFLISLIGINDSLQGFLLSSLITSICTLSLILLIGLDNEEKLFLKNILKR